MKLTTGLDKLKETMFREVNKVKQLQKEEMQKANKFCKKTELANIEYQNEKEQRYDRREKVYKELKEKD